MKIVDPEKLWNFVVDNFLIWNRLEPQIINLHIIWYNNEKPKCNIDTSDSVVQWLRS